MAALVAVDERNPSIDVGKGRRKQSREGPALSPPGHRAAGRGMGTPAPTIAIRKRRKMSRKGVP